MKKWSIKTGVKSLFRKEVAVGGLIVSLTASVAVITTIMVLVGVASR